MTRSFVVIAEATADFIIATELADRTLVDEIDWLDESLLDSQRQWVTEEAQAGSLTWKTIPGRARAAGIRIHGHFDGEPGLPDADAARRAVAYVMRVFPKVDAIVLVRDADDQPERRQGLEQARKLYQSECPIVIGLAQPERESWVISGFIAKNETEENRLSAERQRLGFDPCQHSHKLTAGKDDSAKLSPKRILAELTQGSRDRERDCWQQTPLETLRDQGRENGMAKYLGEIVEKLVPLITSKRKI